VKLQYGQYMGMLNETLHCSAVCWYGLANP
jgi:hypothetical protein